VRTDEQAAVSADRLGSVSEEASKLFEAVGDWARSAAGTADDHIATGSAECTVCPLCQLISVVRGTRPDVVEHLADAAGSVVSAVRAFIDAHEHSWAARPSAPVEHIDIG
jgi:hypothetical protein